MKTELTKQEAEKKIEEFFSNLSGKKPEQIKKIKRLAMHYHISLHDYKKSYCKKCFSVFNSGNSEIRIKKGTKSLKCKKCGEVMRCRLK